MESLHTWAVPFLASADHTVIVEASSLDEAIDLAEEEFSPPSLCHHCSREMNLGDWLLYVDGIYDEGPVA